MTKAAITPAPNKAPKILTIPVGFDAAPVYVAMAGATGVEGSTQDVGAGLQVQVAGVGVATVCKVLVAAGAAVHP